MSEETSDNHGVAAAVVSLICHLPERFHGLWWTTHELCDFLKVGGLGTSIGVAQISSALRTHHDGMFQYNKYNNMHHYMLGTPCQEGWSPAQQKSSFSLVQNRKPRMQKNFFLHSSLRTVEKNIGTVLHAHEMKDAPENDDDGNEHPNKPQHHTETVGFKLMSIDVDREWTNTVTEHVMNCGRRLDFVESEKKGFELIDTYRCGRCQKLIQKRSSHDSQESTMEPSGKPGPKTSEVNALMGVATYAAGIHPTRTEELCAEAGIVCPSKSNLMRMYEKVKVTVLDLSEAALIANRKKHCAECRKQPNYPGDVTFHDRDGNLHSISRGPIAIDGGGGRRAYQHHISGSTHCLIIFSLVTLEPIYVQVDQISCQRCSIAMMKALRRTGKRLEDLSTEDIQHDGQCYRNTGRGPTIAEELACGDAGLLLLKSEDSDEFLPDDIAIFADQIVSDGDTRGAKKFIAAQFEFIGAVVANIVEYLPDIGHFIKTVSNALYDLGEHDPNLKGSCLLEPARIRAMSSDLAMHFRDFNVVLKKFVNKEPDQLSELEQTELNQSRQRCLKRIDAIVPHHCGDHRKCDEACCLYLQIKRRLIVRKQTTGESFCREDIDALYAKEGRFRGKFMSMDKESMAKVANVIRSRVDKMNVDRIALLMSSNLCENYFSCLIKFSEGKRLNLGQTNSWSVLAHFVVGLKSTLDFSSYMLDQFGVMQSEIRMARRLAMTRKREQSKNRKQSERYREQRHVSKMIQAKRMGKDAAKSSAHRSGKLNSKNDCKSTGKKRRSPACSVCREEGHTARECAEPHYAGPRSKSKPRVKRARHSEDTMLEMFPKNG